MGNSGSRGLEDELFNLKFAAKQLVRESQKTEKEMHKEKDKVKKVQIRFVACILACIRNFVTLC